LNKKGKIEIKGRKGGDEGQVSRSILGKRKFSKKLKREKALENQFLFLGASAEE